MGTGKKKIDIKPITDYQSRMVTFSRRRTGLFKKAKKLTYLSGSSIAIVVLSETGQPYIHGSPSLLDRFLSSNATTTIGAGSASTSTIPTGSFVDKFRACVNSGAQACDDVEEVETFKWEIEADKKDGR